MTAYGGRYYYNNIGGILGEEFREKARAIPDVMIFFHKIINKIFLKRERKKERAKMKHQH